MRKLVITLIGTLLITSNAFAASLDARALAHMILNSTSATASANGNLTIVYGGQDISRSKFSSYRARFNSPVRIA